MIEKTFTFAGAIASANVKGGFSMPLILASMGVQLLKLLPMIYVPHNECKQIYKYIPNNLKKHIFKINLFYVF